MDVRQEQVVFAVTAVLVGVLVWTGSDEERATKSRRGGDGAPLERFLAPELPPRAGELEGSVRPLFSPPRDTRPLDPPTLVEPPRDPLPGLAPPSAWGPDPSLWAEHLQRSLGAEFGSAEGPADARLEQQFEDAVGIGGGAGGAGRDTESGDLLGAQFGASSWSELDRTERLEVTEAFKRSYDWLRESDAEILFGRILNDDRFGLRRTERQAEPILFLVLDPFRGTPRFPAPIEYARERLLEFAFADTPQNRIEQAYRDFTDVPTPGTYGRMLDLSEECLELRHEVPRALEIARDLYARCADFRPEDPQPFVGRARALVAALEFDAAFAAYEDVVERFPSRAEPWVGLGELESRFLLEAQAEASLRRAASVEPGSWLANGALGRFLLERGRASEALGALEQAVSNLPAEIGRRDQRVALRLDLARARFALGDVAAARDAFAQALTSDPDRLGAMAGLVACARLGVGEAPAPVADGESLAGVEGAELLYERGLLAAERGDAGAARAALDRAAELDPLGAWRSSAARSWIAARGGDLQQAAELAEEALALDPTQAWCLYHRGRVALARGDLELAESSLRAALEREADLEDALAGLAWIAYERREHDAAERYLERALKLVARRGADGEGAARLDLVALRGWNALRAGAVFEARDAFEAALAVDPRSPTPRAGLAWCELLSGEAEEALIQLRNLDDARRDRPETDPHRVWATEQIARIEDHASKDVWTDRFEYTRIGNGWLVDDAAGPRAELRGGVLFLEGTFQSSGEARFYREYAASELVAVEADLWVGAATSARCGLFLSRETTRQSGTSVQAFAACARARDGSTQVRIFDAGQGDAGWVDLDAGAFPFPADERVHVRIERVGEGSDAVMNVLIDGVPAIENWSASGFGRGNAPLKVGVFAEGETGRTASVRLDDVEVTRRIR